MLLGLKDKSNSLVLSTLAALQVVVLLWTEASDYVPANIETLISLQLNQIIIFNIFGSSYPLFTNQVFSPSIIPFAINTLEIC